MNKQVLVIYREADRVLPLREQIWQVNSRHHRSITTIGGNLRVTAFDPENRTVEALEHPDRRFVLAVQWHPEDQARIDPGQLNIFRSLGAAIV